MKKLMLFFIVGAATLAAFFLVAENRWFSKPYTIQVTLENAATTSIKFSVPEQNKDVAVASPTPKTSLPADIEPQQPLPNPPPNVKAVYATGWSAGAPKKVNYFIDLIKNTELTAIVIDIKDFSGYILYDTDYKPVKEYRAVEIRIPKINSLIKKLHDENIYVIGRLAVFQDPRLAKARPDLAITSSSTKAVWLDNKGLAWIDPAAREAWDYNIGIARDALDRGFDEINFDYIRFPSDGNLTDLSYPLWNQKTSRRKIMSEFFQYLRRELPEAKISADLFGLMTISLDDQGIGQYFEDALPFFDYLSPMLYPSHYYGGSFGYRNPAAHPYEIVRYSMEAALQRMTDYQSKIASSSALTVTDPKYEIKTKLRPWLQDFDLGADYGETEVRNEIQALADAASTTAEFLNGWMLWNPDNIYTRGALEAQKNSSPSQ